MYLIQTIAITMLNGFIQIRFHFRESKLQRFKWFLEARSLHEYHHDLDISLMVADHF